MLKKYKILSLVVLVLILLSFWSLNNERDILYIRTNMDKYHAETNLYKEKIKFTLNSDEILKGIDEPKKITTIYDTDVFVTEVKERENSQNGKKEILFFIGFDSHIKDAGTILSTSRLNNNHTYTGTVKSKVYDEKGKLIVSGGGGGTLEGQFEQIIFHYIDKKEVMKTKQLNFEISDLYLLKYNTK